MRVNLNKLKLFLIFLLLSLKISYNGLAEECQVFSAYQGDIQSSISWKRKPPLIKEVKYFFYFLPSVNQSSHFTQEIMNTNQDNVIVSSLYYHLNIISMRNGFDFEKTNITMQDKPDSEGLYHIVLTFKPGFASIFSTEHIALFFEIAVQQSMKNYGLFVQLREASIIN